MAKRKQLSTLFLSRGAIGAAGGAAGVGLAAKLLTVGVVSAVGVGLVSPSGPDTADSWAGGVALPELQREKSVDVVPIKAVKSLSTDETRAKAITKLPDPRWPEARTVTVTLPGHADRSGTAAATGVPVRVGRGTSTEKGKDRGSAQDSAAGIERLTVRMHGRKDAKTLGMHGVVFELSDPDGRGGPVEVELDYSSFATAYGASWASRLHLVELPACALSTPEKPKCRTATRVDGRNNTKDQTLVGQVVVRGDGGKPEAPPADENDPQPTEETEPPTSEPETPPSEGATPTTEPGGEGNGAGGGGSTGSARALQSSNSPTVLAAVAGAKGAEGDFGVSDLSPAGKWSGGGSSGDFSY